MKIARIEVDGRTCFAVVEAEMAREATSPFIGDLVRLQNSWPLTEVRLLAPSEPSKVIAIAKNYRAHAVELGGEVPEQPMIFLKPPSSVIGPGTAIERPVQSERVDHEAELAVVIGRECRDVPVEDARSVVLGYSCANDVTARDLQAGDGQWSRAKGFDTFCPYGPWIETDVNLIGIDADVLEIECFVDGQLRQQGSTDQMVHSVADLIAHASSVMTLMPGDVLLTGTPSGIGPLEAGSQVEVRISGIGSLNNPVRDR